MHNRILAFFIELAKTIAIVFILAFVIRYFFIQPFVIEGSSMEPNFHNRQLILIDKISYRFHDPKRGDVIVFESPQDPSVYYIKRVIGLPGQHVLIKDGDVYVNGKKLSEPYLTKGQKTSIEGYESNTIDEKIPNDEFFVMGDNRDQSSDSREWGLLKRSAIAGRFMVVLYPRNSWYSYTNQNSSIFSLEERQHSSLF